MVSFEGVYVLSKGMMVELEKQVHLQKVVGAEANKLVRSCCFRTLEVNKAYKLPALLRDDSGTVKHTASVVSPLLSHLHQS